MNEKKIYRIARLIAKQRLDSLNNSELEELQSWVLEDASHKQTYQKLLSGESYKNRNNLKEEIDINSVIETLRQKTIGNVQKPNYKNRIIKIVASIASIIVIGFFLYIALNSNETTNVTENQFNPGSSKAILTLYNGNSTELTASQNIDSIEILLEKDINNNKKENSDETKETLNKIFVPRGGEYSFYLNDGTHVWLNSETTLSYAHNFANDNNSCRVVFLSGEAYFEVAKDSLKPFIVKTDNNLDINVLGTSFNVNSYYDHDAIRITLVKGLVSIKHDSIEQLLNPSQQAEYDKTSERIEVSDILDPSQFYAWKNGMFTFENESLYTVMDAISKWYNIQVVYNDIDMKKIGHFSMNIDKSENLLPLISLLSEVTGLNIDIIEGRINITKK